MIARRILVLVFFPAMLLAAAEISVVPVPYMMKSNADWWRLQYGGSSQDWTAALGPDYRNRNSGPACVLMLIHYKKRTGIPLAYGSFRDPRFPAVHSEARWKFCRDNPENRGGGGFAPDDSAEVSAEEIRGVLAAEDIPAAALPGRDEAAVARAVGRCSPVISRLDPSAYFADEPAGGGRWVVVFGADPEAVTIHDPGRPEGRSLRLKPAVFSEALRRADGGRGGAMIECFVAIGNFPDGWHADGRSRAFVDGYLRYRERIGRPHNPGATFYAHYVGTCVVQDFKQDPELPHYGRDGASLLFLDLSWPRTWLVKAEFLEAYMKIWGFDRLGSARSDEYPTPAGRRQDFEKGYLFWDGKRVQVKYGF